MKNLHIILMLLIALSCPLIHAEKAVPSNPGASLDRPSHQAHEASKPQKNQGKADKKEEPPVPASKPDTSKNREENERQEAIQRDKDDLIAQERMAEASEKAVVYTYRGLIVSAIALIFTAIIGGLSFWVAIRSETRARRHEQIDLRAYLLVDIEVIDYNALNTALTNINNPPPNEIYRLKIRNAGRTPARNIRITTKTTISPWPKPNLLPLVMSDLQALVMGIRFTLGPGAETEVLVKVEEAIRPEEITNLKSLLSFMYVYGQITYTDFFGENRKTEFRYVHKLTNANGAFNDTIEAHHQGNDMT